MFCRRVVVVHIQRDIQLCALSVVICAVFAVVVVQARMDQNCRSRLSPVGRQTDDAPSLLSAFCRRVTTDCSVVTALFHLLQN